MVTSGQPADDLIDLVADFLVAFERQHVVERAALGHVDQPVGIGLFLIRQIFNEWQRQDIVLYCDASSPPPSSSTFPERTAQIRLFFKAIGTNF